eukprot:107221_1
MPGVALQIYAALSQEKPESSLIVSILVSTVTITYSVWMYLVKLTNKEGAKYHKTVLEDNDNESSTPVVSIVELEVQTDGGQQLQTEGIIEDDIDINETEQERVENDEQQAQTLQFVETEMEPIHNEPQTQFVAVSLKGLDVD